MNATSTGSSSNFILGGVTINVNRWSGFTVVRTVLAFVLLSAAILKTHQLIASPVSPQQLWTWAEISLEWLMSAWLLSGLYVYASRYAAMLCFAIFAAVAFAKGWRGDNSCGCFGPIQIHPWASFGFDMIAILALASFRPTRSPRLRQSLSLIVALLMLSMLTSFMFWSARPVRLHQVGFAPADGSRVILEPSKWVGQSFPLKDYLRSGNDFGRDKWLVLLYHHDCSNCLEAIDELNSDSDKFADDGIRFALIEVPPFGGRKEIEPNRGVFRRDQLPENRDWIVATPSLLWIQDGIVKRVHNKLSEALGGEAESIVLAESTTQPIIIQAAELHHDLGYIAPSSSHIIRYTIENASEQPLVIDSAQSECSCMTAPDARMLIDAKSSGAVDVAFDAPKLTGHYSKRILLLPQNSQTQPIEIRLSARIGLPLRIEPETLELGELRVGQRVNKAITIYNDGVQPVKLLYATSLIPGCVVKVPRHPIAAGSSTELPVQITPNEKWSQSRSLSVSFQTNEPNQPTLQASVNYEVISQQTALSPQ